MSMEDFKTKYTPDASGDRMIFNIGDPECREAVRLIQMWIGNGMLSHIFFDYMALAGALRQAYDQGRQDERAALHGETRHMVPEGDFQRAVRDE